MALVVSKSKIEAFAAGLVQTLSTRYPPEMDKDRTQRRSESHLTRIVENLCEQAVTFRDAEGLGWLGKARLGNALRWQLADKGYRKDFVDLTTEAVVVKLSQPAGRS